MIATAIALLTLAIWIYLMAFRGAFWRMREESPPGTAPGGLRIAVVIPARDEAATIARTVGSLRNQQYDGRIEVIVVDDHSADATARMAAEEGATVIASLPLPAGWTGKMWAVSQGVERALAENPDYLLLTDADIEHDPMSVAGLVARAEAGKLVLTSHMVRLNTETAPEKMLIPAFVYFFLKLYPPGWIADRRRSVAGAAGGCMLVRPEALARAGGIASIRGEVIDDCALARLLKPQGPIWLGLTLSTRSLRVYRSFGEIRGMIARTAFTQLQYSALLLAGTLAGMLLTYVAPVVLTFSGVKSAQAPAAAAWLLMSLSYLPALRLYRQSPLWALALPLIAAFYSAATLESAIRYWTGSGGQWKGRAQAPKSR